MYSKKARERCVQYFRKCADRQQKKLVFLYIAYVGVFFFFQWEVKEQKPLK